MKISIVLPTYNGERYLALSIQSVLDSTERDWELIIVDDCSVDNTLEIASDFAKKDNRISVISNSTNQKLPASLNIGFEKANGKYLTWTSDDNLYKPDALSLMSRYLDEHPNTDLVSFAEDIIDENGAFQGDRVKVVYRDGHRNLSQLMFYNNVGAAFMYRKAIAKRVGQYDINAFGSEDYDYWYRIALEGQLDYVDDINVYQYRKHTASLTSAIPAQVRRSHCAIVSKYAPQMFNKLNLTKRDIAFVRWRSRLDSVPFYYKAYFSFRKKLAHYIAMFIFWNKVLRRDVRYTLEPHLSLEKES